MIKENSFKGNCLRDRLITFSNFLPGIMSVTAEEVRQMSRMLTESKEERRLDAEWKATSSHATSRNDSGEKIFFGVAKMSREELARDMGFV